MSFEWQHFLELAQDLVNSHGDGTDGDADPETREAALRTAVSRAYYAAYHAVREYVSATGRGDPPRGDSHTWVWNQLDPRQRRQEGQMKREGFKLLKTRKSADYDLDSVGNWTKQAKFDVDTSRTILKLVADIQPKT